MKTIKLTQGKETIIDDEDYENLIQYKWCVIKKRDQYYAGRGIWENGKTKIVYMHKILISTKKYIDHINGNTLDNRRINLRICSNKENIRNSKNRKNNTSGFKGVSKLKRLISNPFVARIVVNYKHIHLGYFSTAIEAAKAYNKASVKYFGEFARLNKI